MTATTRYYYELISQYRFLYRLSRIDSVLEYNYSYDSYDSWLVKYPTHSLITISYIVRCCKLNS